MTSAQSQANRELGQLKTCFQITQFPEYGLDMIEALVPVRPGQKSFSACVLWPHLDTPFPYCT